jgi:hypothetical protein
VCLGLAADLNKALAGRFVSGDDIARHVGVSVGSHELPASLALDCQSNRAACKHHTARADTLKRSPAGEGRGRATGQTYGRQRAEERRFFCSDQGTGDQSMPKPAPIDEWWHQAPTQTKRRVRTMLQRQERALLWAIINGLSLIQEAYREGLDDLDDSLAPLFGLRFIVKERCRPRGQGPCQVGR